MKTHPTKIISPTNRKRCIGVVSLLMLLCVSRSLVVAQTEPVAATSVDSVTMLRNVLEEKKNDRERMERMLASLNAVDSVYKVHYPTWVVQDADLRERIYRTFRMRYTDVPSDTTVTVVANPDADEILEISIGSVVMGRRDTHVNLSDSLHKEILAAKYPMRVINPIPVKPRAYLLFGSRPKFAAISVSAFGAGLLFSDGRGVEVKLGHEEIGYHFWSTGDFRAMAVFEQLKIGLIIPFRYGRTEVANPEPLSIRPRRLSGAKGVSGEFDYPFSSQLVGARLSVGELNSVSNPELLTNLQQFYYIHTIAQLFYSRQEMFSAGEHLFTFTGGLGYHQIALGETKQNGRITATQKVDFASPILRAEYVHQGGKMYGLGVQYYSGILHVKGWVEFVKNFIYVDVQYYSPAFRGAKPWEQTYFFMISPRIQLIY
jgi:hypothetical protein